MPALIISMSRRLSRSITGLARGTSFALSGAFDVGALVGTGGGLGGLIAGGCSCIKVRAFEGLGKALGTSAGEPLITVSGRLILLPMLGAQADALGLAGGALFTAVGP